MKPLYVITGVLSIFYLGYLTHDLLHPPKSCCHLCEKEKKKNDEKPEKEKPVARESAIPRVTGLGGIFFKSKDPEKLRQWYQDHFGMSMDDYGTNFEWRQGMHPEKYGFTLWAPFIDKTKYFNPSEKEFMINYRVHKLDALLASLKEKGILPVDSMEKTEYGNFIHLMDPEGNKIELWEPIDVVYDTIINARTK